MHLTHNCLIELHFSVLPFIRDPFLQIISQQLSFLNEREFLVNAIQIRNRNKTFQLMTVTWSHPWILCSHFEIASGWASPSFFLSNFPCLNSRLSCSITLPRELKSRARISSLILKMSILFFPFDFFHPIADFTLFFMENGNEIRYLLMMMRFDEVISFNFLFARLSERSNLFSET